MSRFEMFLCGILLGLSGCSRVPHSLQETNPPAPPTAVDTADGRSTVNNGSDFADPTDGAAWFLGDRAIRYCAEISPGFDVPESSVRLAIEKSFGAWADYIRTSGINNPNSHPERFGRGDERKLSVRFHPMVACDGNEDLKLLFGAQNTEVVEAAKRYRTPIAFAKRTSYAPLLGRGRGFIWVAESLRYQGEFPDWSASHRALGLVLMHELGHVFGCAHAPDTIMDERLSQAIRSLPKRGNYLAPNAEAEDLELSVDLPGGRDLVRSGPVEPEGKDLGNSLVRIPSLSRFWFAFPKHAVHTEAALGLRHAWVRSESRSEVGVAELLLDLQNTKRVQSDSLTPDLFKIAYLADEQWVVRVSHPESVTHTGQTLGQNEKEKYRVLVVRNAAEHRIALKVWDGEKLLSFIRVGYLPFSQQLGLTP